MNSSNERAERNTKTEETPVTSLPIGNPIGEDTRIEKSGKNDVISSSPEDNALPDSERANLQWEIEKFLANFTFFLDLSWKALGLFFAILGGILAIYFGKDSSNKDVIKFLLVAPLIMSIILSLIFFASGKLWMNLIPKIDDIAKKLEMTTTPNFRLLTSLFYVFGLTLIATAAGLIWLIGRLV